MKRYSREQLKGESPIYNRGDMEAISKVLNARVPWVKPQDRKRVLMRCRLFSGANALAFLLLAIWSNGLPGNTVPINVFLMVMAPLILAFASHVAGPDLTRPNEESDRKFALLSTSTFRRVQELYAEIKSLGATQCFKIRLTEEEKRAFEARLQDLKVKLGEVWVLAHVEADLIETESEVEAREDERRRERLQVLSAIEQATRVSQETAAFLASCEEAGHGELVVLLPKPDLEQAELELREVR